jgi:hypothetical protein
MLPMSHRFPISFRLHYCLFSQDPIRSQSKATCVCVAANPLSVERRYRNRPDDAAAATAGGGGGGVFPGFRFRLQSSAFVCRLAVRDWGGRCLRAVGASAPVAVRRSVVVLLAVDALLYRCMATWRGVAWGRLRVAFPTRSPRPRSRLAPRWISQLSCPLLCFAYECPLSMTSMNSFQLLDRATWWTSGWWIQVCYQVLFGRKSTILWHNKLVFYNILWFGIHVDFVCVFFICCFAQLSFILFLRKF